MAAPTNVRVESNSLTTATLRWTYTGTNPIGVWRSLTSGSGFVEVTAVGTRVVPGTTTYTDTGLTPGTRYFYKLSDDGGSTFSSEVNVTTQACFPPAGSLDTFSLDRISHGAGDPVEEFQEELQQKFNNLAERVEAVLHGRVLVPGDCVACPENGALVLNCTAHCKQWLVVVDEDINSISLQYCDEGPGNIDFIIPPNTTRIVRGWPAGFGFTGDEPSVSGGTEGRTISVATNPGGKASTNSKGRPSTGRGIGPGSGGGSGAGGCSCVPTGSGNLTIKSCNANNSMNCSSTKKLQLKVCGGTPPYVWSTTGTVTSSNATGPSTTISPPANPGSTVSGTAFWRSFYECGGCAGGACNVVTPEQTVLGNCDDTSSGCTTTSFCASPGASSMTCGCGLGSPGQVGCGTSPQLCGSCGTGTCGTRQGGNGEGRVDVVCDQRSAGMIAAGCSPCSLIAAGAGSTVTVTDAAGTQTTVILRP